MVILSDDMFAAEALLYTIPNAVLRGCCNHWIAHLICARETSHAYYEYTYAQLFFFRHCEGLFVCNKDSSASEAVCVDASIEAITFDVQVMGKEVWRVRVDMEKARLISYRTGSTSNLNE